MSKKKRTIEEIIEERSHRGARPNICVEQGSEDAALCNQATYDGRLEHVRDRKLSTGSSSLKYSMYRVK